MEYHTITVNKDGRVQIPKHLREAMNLEDGGELVAEVKDGVFQAKTRKQQLMEAAQHAQDFFVPFKKEGESILDELSQERREAAHKENVEFGLSTDA